MAETTTSEQPPPDVVAFQEQWAALQAEGERNIAQIPQEGNVVSLEHLQQEAERIKQELIRQAEERRERRALDETRKEKEDLADVEKGDSSSRQSFMLLEGVDPSNPRLPAPIKTLLDSDIEPQDRNRLVRTHPAHDLAFGHAYGSLKNVSYYPDHIPLPAWYHWIVTCLCMALFGVILPGEIRNCEGVWDATAAAVILLMICVAPALYCLWWGRRSCLRRQPLFDGDFPGRWRQGYYTIGKEALVDYTNMECGSFPSNTLQPFTSEQREAVDRKPPLINCNTAPDWREKKKKNRNAGGDAW